ncbi:MAG: cobalamin biosynthesis protein CbiG [Ilumatobacteraceae bacterium]
MSAAAAAGHTDASMPLRVERFERFVIVDWSAASSPVTGADSIWSVTKDARIGDGQVVNHPTRADARHHLIDVLTTSPGTRTLLGIDVSLGYPAGFAARTGIDEATTPPWLATWQHLAASLDDDRRNRNNRWQVAADLNRRLGTPHFWGAPAAHAGPHLTRTKPARTVAHLPDLRAAEARLARLGHRPFSIWQLLGVGSVGSQSLTAIPVMHHLRTHPLLVDRCAVWPFETGLCLPARPDIVITEVWPSSLDQALIDAESHPVKDARQVMALARLLAAEQAAGSLAAWFEPNSGDDLDAAAVIAEEGWTLGVR